MPRTAREYPHDLRHCSFWIGEPLQGAFGSHHVEGDPEQVGAGRAGASGWDVDRRQPTVGQVGCAAEQVAEEIDGEHHAGGHVVAT